MLVLASVAKAYWLEVVLPALKEFLAYVGVTDTEEQRLIIILTVALCLLTAYMLLLVIVRGSRRRQRLSLLPALTRGPRRVAALATLMLVLVFSGWAQIAPLSSAALAVGVVSPEGSRKVVKHLEGGIVREINVQEGDFVLEGAPLVIMDNVQAKALFDELYGRYRYLLAVEARLMAEQESRTTILFPTELSNSSDPNVVTIMTAQKQLLESRVNAALNRGAILEKRVLQLQRQNAGLHEVIAAENRQVELLEEEVSTVKELYETGLAKYPRLLALMREQADIEASKAENVARIAANEEQIGETELQLIAMKEQIVEEANSSLAEVQRSLSEIRAQLPSRRDTLARTTVLAPISGRVLNLSTKTVGGVLGPGETILEIVPDNSSLVIDARVKPNDIDRIYPGMETRVILSAYKQRNLPLMHGVLASVSADRVIEDRTGAAYFLAKVELDPAILETVDDIRMVPGMPAEVMILDADRTLFEYLFNPIVQSMNRSFRED
ncbi:HlyD family type I secretion periplasmic adaptor subunit [Celeribacter litoreus]|uniref:HlyD family type I secretion periplasmic adaptor subunit n=1 Tax=Celeribacter litoreus TaxID=2876714 RepID=UPI001CCB1D62|nr:HlyD family type I secretion periplasmic adaptor subunit [Celeribacter litoreus]